MNYRIVIQANFSSEDGILGAKESIADALELMGCSVDYINVMPRKDEEKCTAI